MKYSFVFLFFILVCLHVEAQHIITDRPDQTEASSIVPVNSLQIEMGFISERINQLLFHQRYLDIPLMI